MGRFLQLIWHVAFQLACSVDTATSNNEQEKVQIRICPFVRQSKPMQKSGYFDHIYSDRYQR